MTAPSTDWKEIVPEGEEARLEKLAEELHQLQKKRAQGKKAGRALHLKANLGVEGTFDVLGDLPEHARQGLFAAPKTYRAYARFSNGSGASQPDRQGDVRGLAIKVLGVDGKKVIPALENAKTQDFLLVQTGPAAPFRSPEEFVALVVAASGSPLLALPRLAGRIGLGRAISLLRAVLGGIDRPFPSFTARTLYSLLPVRWGPYAARLALLPVGDSAQVPSSGGPDSLGDDLRTRLRDGKLEWDLRAQFFLDETRTPIENPTVDWKESDSPYVTVARLTLPKQDLASDRGKKLGEFIETLSFDPWHALVEHRPLGALMRARNTAYRVSGQERGAAGEPDGSETF